MASYRVVRNLAASSHGDTDLVADEGGRLHVVKEFAAGTAGQDVLQRMAQVRHPNLQEVEQVWDGPEGRLMALLQYVEGPTAEERIEQGGPLSTDDAVRVVLDVTGALQALHGAGLVHRDVKADNVVLTDAGAVLIDPGIARVTDPGAAKDTTVMGTWGYAAPEQLGFAQTDARSDVWACGRLLGHLLTGIHPREPEFVDAMACDELVPRELQHIIARACAFEPSRRPQDAGELAVLLRSAIGERSPLLAPRSAPVRPLTPAEAQEVLRTTTAAERLSASVAVAAPMPAGLRVLGAFLGFMGACFFLLLLVTGIPARPLDRAPVAFWVPYVVALAALFGLPWVTAALALWRVGPWREDGHRWRTWLKVTGIGLFACGAVVALCAVLSMVFTG